MQKCLIKHITRRIGFSRRLYSSSTSTAEEASEEPKRWQLFSAAILERIPKIMKPLSQFEIDYRLYRHEAKLAFARKMSSSWFPKGQREDPVTGEVLIGEFSRRNFNPASLETEADRSGNNKTLDRKLADSIYFVVKRENRVWQFPQGEAEDGKTLRQTAEEALNKFVGDRLTLHFVSNIPACHIEREFPSKLKQFSTLLLIRSTNREMAPKKPTKKDAKSESDASASEEEVKPKKAAVKKTTKPKAEAADDGKPKKPLNSYFLYAKENRARVAETHKGGVQKQLGKEWKALPESEKEEYKARAAKAKEEYEREVAAFE